MKLTWRKWLAVTLVLTTTAVPATGASAITDSKSYQDIANADGWAQASIQQARDLGLMSGDGNGNFRPIDSITREEVAVVFARTLQLPTPTVSTSTFQDVDPNGWSHAAIEALAAAGLMTGDGDGAFRPDEMVTREEMAVLLVKAAGLPASAGDKLAIADRDAVSPWARGYVQAAMEAGLLRGDGTNFHPRSRAMRQEVAAMAINLYQKLDAP